MKGKKLNTEAVICGGLSILVFLLLWQFAVSFTSVGLLIPGPVTTFKDFLSLLSFLLASIPFFSISASVFLEFWRAMSWRLLWEFVSGW